MLLLDGPVALWLLVGGSIAMVVGELVRAMLPSANDLMIRVLPLFKRAEQSDITGATFLWLAATFTYLVYDLDVAVLALLFLAVGDPAAALVGVRDRRFRVFGKSVVGSSAFAVIALAAGIAASVHADVALAWWIVPGAVAAAAVELAPLPMDDNVSIPIIAGALMTGLAAL